jgi:hypothetical protein
MIPALKYIVTIMNLYHTLLAHISFCVTRYPTKPDAVTISSVPITVLATVTDVDKNRSLTAISLT